MEINTQQLEALHQLQEQQTPLNRKSNLQSNGFETFLNNELANDVTTAPVVDPMGNLAPTDLYANFIAQGTDAIQATNPDVIAMQAAFDQASGTLDMWDSYVTLLGSSQAGPALRQAYSLLDGIDARLGELKANPATSGNANLQGLLNELEIMSTTERIKFNRGDYLM